MTELCARPHTVKVVDYFTRLLFIYRPLLKRVCPGYIINIFIFYSFVRFKND